MKNLLTVKSSEESSDFEFQRVQDLYQLAVQVL